MLWEWPGKPILWGTQTRRHWCRLAPPTSSAAPVIPGDGVWRPHIRTGSRAGRGPCPPGVGSQGPAGVAVSPTWPHRRPGCAGWERGSGPSPVHGPRFPLGAASGEAPLVVRGPQAFAPSRQGVGADSRIPVPCGEWSPLEDEGERGGSTAQSPCEATFGAPVARPCQQFPSLTPRRVVSVGCRLHHHGGHAGLRAIGGTPWRPGSP